MRFSGGYSDPTDLGEVFPVQRITIALRPLLCAGMRFWKSESSSTSGFTLISILTPRRQFKESLNLSGRPTFPLPSALRLSEHRLGVAYYQFMRTSDAQRLQNRSMERENLTAFLVMADYFRLARDPGKIPRGSR
jgi:hypothetical protein